jgi:hypothetical protein
MNTHSEGVVDSGIVVLVALTSLTDATMVQFLPWRPSKFYEASKGFASHALMKMLLAIKIVQSIASAFFQLQYLMTETDINSPITSLQAKALFAMNIGTSVGGVLVGSLMLFLKTELLHTIDQSETDVWKKKEGREEEAGASSSSSSSYPDNAAHDSMALHNVYRRDSAVMASSNPLHTEHHPAAVSAAEAHVASSVVDTVPARTDHPAAAAVAGAAAGGYNYPHPAAAGAAAPTAASSLSDSSLSAPPPPPRLKSVMGLVTTANALSRSGNKTEAQVKERLEADNAQLKRELAELVNLTTRESQQEQAGKEGTHDDEIAL